MFLIASTYSKAIGYGDGIFYGVRKLLEGELQPQKFENHWFKPKNPMVFDKFFLCRSQYDSAIL